MDINYQLLDAIQASIYWKDLEGVYLGCNKYMVIMAGLERRDQIVGKTDYHLPWRKQANKIREIDQLVIKNNRTYEIEENPRTHNNVMKSFLSSKTPLINDDNKIIGLIGVSIDITEKKNVETILRKTELSLEKSLNIKERFLKNISHETRNPLQAFVVTAETLAEKWSMFNDTQKHESVKLIADSARRLATLVNNTFDLSRLISKDSELKLENSDINLIIKEVVNSLDSSFLGNKKARIITNFSKKHYICFDNKKIKQVIYNLLLNALKWTPKEKDIVIELHEAMLPNSSIAGIQCCIKDEGIKIPQEELNFIFEPFTESSNTASKACGVGLGLALCKEIIKMHRGEIWAENNIKEGVTFSFIIPYNLEITD